MATKKTTTKKTTAKKTVAKKTVAKKPAVKKTVKVAPKKVDNHVADAYFWGGLAIALCAAGAFIVFALGIGAMIR